MLGEIQEALRLPWKWLGDNYREVSAVGSITFGALGVTAAWLAYRLNRRNNFGWPPMVLVVSYGGGNNGIAVEFEVWNRRKYPIVVRTINVVYKRVKLEPDEYMRLEDWCVSREEDGVAQLYKAVRIDPSSHVTFQMRRTITHGGFEEPTIEIIYFDPRVGRVLEIVSKGDSWRNYRIWFGIWKATKVKLLGRSGGEIP